MEMSGHLHDPAAFSPGKEPPLPISQEVECAPEPVWSGGEEKNPTICCEYTPVIQPVA